MPRTKPNTTFTKRVKATTTWLLPNYADYFTLDTTAFTCDTTSFTCDKVIESITWWGLTTAWDTQRYDTYVQDLIWTIVTDLEWELVLWISWCPTNIIQSQWNTTRHIWYFTLDTTLFTCDDTTFTCDKSIDKATGWWLHTNWREVRYGSLVLDINTNTVQDLNWEDVVWLVWMDTNLIQTRWN